MEWSGRTPGVNVFSERVARLRVNMALHRDSEALSAGPERI